MMGKVKVIKLMSKLREERLAWLPLGESKLSSELREERLAWLPLGE